MLSRLGFPSVGRHRRFVVAIAVDAVGSGVFLPVSVLYFLRTTSLSLTSIGLALSIAAAVQLPFGPLVGGLVDRVGPRRVLLAANLLEAAGFIGYVGAHHFAALLVCAVLVQLGQTGFWSSYSPVVATISAPGERERWFGFLGALRNASFAVGGLVAALAITIGTRWAFTGVVLVNAASYVAAFALIATMETSPMRSRSVPELAAAPGGWGQVLRDRAYVLLVVTNVTYALSAITLNIAVPVYVTHLLGLPGWVAGAVFTLNTVLIGVGQGLVVNAMTGSIRADIIAVGCLLYAASYVVLLAASWTSVAAGVVVVLVGAVVYTGGELVAGPVLTALSTDAAPAQLRGRYVSLYQMSWTVSLVIAPATLTWLLERGATALWTALVLVSLTGVGLTRVLLIAMPQAATAVEDTRAPRAPSAPASRSPEA